MRSPTCTRPLHLLLLLAGVLISWSAFSASAYAADPLTLAPAVPLSAVGAPLVMKVGGVVDGIWTATHATLTLKGPGRPGDDEAKLATAATVEAELGNVGPLVTATLTVPADKLTQPGAYFAVVHLTAQGGKSGKAAVWVGRVSALPPDIDLAFVLPVAVGVHRDPEGDFVDEVVQAAAVPKAAAPGSLYAYFDTAQRFPDLHMTLGVEPILLEQLRAQADGFTVVDGDKKQQLTKDSEAARNATQALVAFESTAGRENVQIVPGPYAMPDLTMVARDGWPDGLDQMLLGKQVVQSVLGLPDSPRGAYAPGLEMTTDSLGLFSGASIDYTVVMPDVARDLVETPADLSHPVRARDRDNGRLTLLFADPRLRATLAAPWDANLFFAALAAELADGKTGPFVVAAADDYALAPRRLPGRPGRGRGPLPMDPHPYPRGAAPSRPALEPSDLPHPVHGILAGVRDPGLRRSVGRDPRQRGGLSGRDHVRPGAVWTSSACCCTRPRAGTSWRVEPTRPSRTWASRTSTLPTRSSTASSTRSTSRAASRSSSWEKRAMCR